jgi:hypothetical protein
VCETEHTSVCFDWIYHRHAIVQKTSAFYSLASSFFFFATARRKEADSKRGRKATTTFQIKSKKKE